MSFDFKDYIDGNEKVLKVVYPSVFPLKNHNDRFLGPISKVYFFVAIIVTIGGLSEMPMTFVKNFFFLLLSPCLLVYAFYWAYGRFIYKKWLLRHIFYVITDKRILKFHPLFLGGYMLISKEITEIGRPRLEKWTDTVGDIIINPPKFIVARMYENTGLDLLSKAYKQDINLYNVENPEDVIRLIREILDRARSSI